jgi:prolyl-tRNA synthetase
MKASKLFFKNYKEVPAEAEIKSHQLMLKAGLIKQQASGIYAYMPLGFKVLKKIENVIRQEMNKAGSQELLMPGILPQEVYKGRLSKFGPEMFKLKDRKGGDYCLTPTHEELFALTVKDSVTSYKQLPISLYQIQRKYRDERRPRFGVQRSREFFMKDAYSFDIDESGLEDSYIAMYNAYVKIFRRLELDFVPVSADSGSMGGKRSEEFMVKSEVGEDTIVFCDNCGYAANEEKAYTKLEEVTKVKELKCEQFQTLRIGKIKDLVNEYGFDIKKLAKTLIYMADSKPVAVMLRGDRDVQEVKLLNALGADEFRLATAEEVEEYIGCKPGFVGPIGLDIEVIADLEIEQMQNFVVGTGDDDSHFINVNLKDFKVSKFTDIKTIKAGDKCPQCDGTLKVMKGIEVGHIFQLGTTYSERLGVTVLDENGAEVIVQMGSYGIGLGRTMAAIVEQKADDKGIVWPQNIAPFDATVLAVNTKNEEQMALATDLYNSLTEKGGDILFDDRKASFGARMKDSELLGIPYIIIAGKKAVEGIFEFVDRRTGVKTEVTKEQILNDQK